ncbi:ATP-binding protein [Candidatus Shapirobacteria bacterium]|nr:ATP-binding protein [Candidatus Shapirobacteria bacterium]
MKGRYLTEKIVADLGEKMVFLSGPRQVGKTTLAQYLGKRYFSPFAYLNWDYQPDRKKIINFQFPGEAKLLIFDELHKWKNWKNYLKGIYDKQKTQFKILVTGSAKLDIYQRGGDSLTGRYYHYLLHPFSLAELLFLKPKPSPFKALNFLLPQKAELTLQRLLKFGPFPEPYLKQEARYWRRWQSARLDRLIKEEIRDLRMIADLANLQILVEILPDKVASPLSVNNLREDLEVAHKTLVNYLQTLEFFYFHFRVFPYTRKKIRTIKKMSKLYLWDWSTVPGEGPKLENLIAAHLLKLAHYLKNVEGEKAELFYLRDLEGKEVDFLLVVEDKPWFAVEVKLEETGPSPSLLYFGKKLAIPYLYQVVRTPEVDLFNSGVRVISAAKFLTGLV